MQDLLIDSPTTDVDALLTKVYHSSGYDFRDYRRGTVERRLERRLHAAGVTTCRDYMEYLDAHSEEYHRLADDLTIKTSGFFRSPYSYQQVARLVLPELPERNGFNRGLRFWSAACARGEEPYSIAILLAESLGPRASCAQVFATDVSRAALGQAEAGTYSPAEIEGLSPERLERYFVRRDQRYEVGRGVRQMVRFSRFDLTSARPPFKEVDCIFCCNVLIYFQRPLQESVLGMLCDSLATPGYLVLGEVETPTGNLSDRLQCLDSRARIYRKM